MTPLILVHGYLGGSAQWSNLFTHLRDIDPYPVDLPGFGKNNHMKPLRSIREMAEFVLDFVEHQGFSTFDLLGHSMGGMVAQELAFVHASRIRKLVLYSTGSIGTLPGRFETIDESKNRILTEGCISVAERISATWYKDLQESPHHFASAEIAKKATQDAMLCGLEAMQNWDGHDQLASIKSETLIIWGTEDRTYTRQQIDLLHEQIENSKLVRIIDASHAIHDEKPDELASKLRSFLNKV